MTNPAANTPMTEGASALKQILAFIHFHRLEKGDRLPSEREFSQRFDVLRSAVREAFAVLDAMRITERRSTSGIFLINGLEDASLESLVIQAKFDLPFSEQTMRDMMETRALLETHAIRLACAHRTDADLDHLRGLVRVYFEHIKKGLDLAERDAEFHMAMAAAGKNMILVKSLAPLVQMNFRWRQKYFSSSAVRRRSLADHREFVEAIADRDHARASALIQRHLQTTIDAVLAIVGQGSSLSPELPQAVANKRASSARKQGA
jgi:GntR family transcriptional regulator, transcriptional repressor for pyruvate dehydrogenase complex